jgi:hypothetical protein
VSSWKTYLQHHPVARELLVLLGFFFVFVQMAWLIFVILSYLTPILWFSLSALVAAGAVLSALSVVAPQVFKRIEIMAAGHGLNLSVLDFDD